MAAQKIHATTQKFTGILDFVDSIVVLEGGNAAMIIEITASNFALLSRREQESRVFSYASLLNSLSFPIQILIRNKRIDITLYLKELDNVIEATKNERLRTYISYYRTFVQEMVTVNVVLNKSFYIVVPFSPLEGGVTNVAQQTTTKKTSSPSEMYAEKARKTLQGKTDSMLGQLQKFAMSAKILERQELIKLFYDIYNEGTTIEPAQADQDVHASVITQEEKV